jgi:hypothetical protein
MDIAQPRWSAGQLSEPLKGFAKHRNVPIFNLEIYQEGVVTPASVETFKEARRQLGWK